MSAESAKAFLKRMNTDVAFAQRVTGCTDPKARAALVKGEGYEFTNDELFSIKELGDEQLDAVVGGMARRVTCGGVSYAECC